MPSTRPQAAFEPIPPGLNIRQLVETTPNFEWATRVHCEMIEYHGMDQFERLVLLHVILGGKPLVIEGYETKLDQWTFAAQWLRDNWGTKVVDARDLTASKNVPMTVQHYLRHMALLTNQWDEHNYKDKDRQRMYLKDIDCPPIWADKLKDHLPLGSFYLNDGTGDVGGYGAMNEPDPNGPGVRRGRGVAKSGDLMSSLPKEMRAENLMCYIGHEGTYTPAHREMCASLGQNIMVEASTATIEDGKLTKPGTSIWFMTETKEREVVSEYWLSRLGHDIEIEKHFAQINAWKQAPFKVHVVEQKPGDLILIPPLAPHQVWNRGTRTMKVAWNRTTVETLEMAMNEALPKARMVCRDEQYKNKAMIYFTLRKYSKMLTVADKQRKGGMHHGQSDTKVRQLQKDFKRLQNLFTKIMVSEAFSPEREHKKVDFVLFDSNITCSYCRCNIFNRFLTCPSCIGKLPDGDDDTYDICMDCYAMGRSCRCISKLQWVEQWKWNDLKDDHDLWRRQIIELEGKVDSRSPKSLRTELNLLGKKRTLAQICEIELDRRPFHDPKKEAAENEKRAREVEREEIDEVDANGNVRKKKKIRRSEKYIREHGRCHVDCYWEPKWKQAHCSKCEKNYCYGNLFRAYDMLPQDVMADPEWECPSCRRICGCRHCRHKPGFKQYTPKGTLLGHNTKSVADPRSVESLVDFSHPNLAWIQKAGDDYEEDTLRLRRRLRQAEADKAKEAELGDDYVTPDGEDVEARILQLAAQEGIPIDPALGRSVDGFEPESIEDEDAIVEHPEEPHFGANAAVGHEHNLRFMVPDGGIMWDTAHAYEPTNAITYVYPDLDPPTYIPLAPAEGYTPTLIPGYETAMPQEKGDRIEMVGSKRKRAKVDDGDRPYAYKKKSKPSTKTRKSLVIKLAVNKHMFQQLVERLEEAQRTAQDATAPVVSSDLQALNLDSHGVQPELLPEAFKDVELLPTDQDDDFTPSRYRDRRKPLPDGALRSAHDGEITRRTTRMHAVTYAEPDEEEFDETVEPQGNKLLTMEKAVRDIGKRNLPGTKSQSGVKQPPDFMADGGLLANKRPVSNAKAQSFPNSTQSVDAHFSDIAIHSTKRPAVVQLGPAGTSQSPSPPSSTDSEQMPSRIVAEAQANRRAKMAAIEGVLASDSEGEDNENDNGNDDGDEDRGSTDQETTPEAEHGREGPSDKSASLVSKHVHKGSVGSKAPRLSLPATSLSRATPPVKKAVTRPGTVHKISAADWGDSSSDDDLPTTKRPNVASTRPGFVTVNGAGTRGHHVPPPARGSTVRRRGRPPKLR